MFLNNDKDVYNEIRYTKKPNCKAFTTLYQLPQQSIGKDCFHIQSACYILNLLDLNLSDLIQFYTIPIERH